MIGVATHMVAAVLVPEMMEALEAEAQLNLPGAIDKLLNRYHNPIPDFGIFLFLI